MTETLNTSGFLFEQTEVALALLTADFGDGYQAAALIGDATGLRTWSIRIEGLPGLNDDVPGITDNLDYAVEYVLRETGDFLLREDGGKIVLEFSSGTSSRAAYLWRFFLKSKRLGNQPFWIEAEDPEDGAWKFFLASFVDHKLTYQILCSKLFSTGLQLQQRRVVGVDSPVSPLPL